MAIGFVANRAVVGVATATTANITIPLVNPQLITQGNTLFLGVYAGNNTSNVSSITPGAVVTDPRGNQWVAEGYQTSSDGATLHGGTLMVYRCLVINAYLAGDSLQIFSALSGFVALFEVREFAGVSQSGHAIASGGSLGTASPSLVTSPTTASGQLVIGFAGIDSANTITGDADTLDGSWAAIFPAAAGFGQLASQHKILTGFTSSPQSWATTWTTSGLDNRWAAILLTYDPSNASPPVQQFPPQDNPNYACPDSGFEPMPTSTAKLQVDTGSAYQIEHTIPAYSIGTHGYAAVTQYDGSETAQQQHHIAYDLYQTGSEVPQDVVTQLVFPVGGAALGADATIIGGGGTAAAIQSAGGSFLKFDALPTAEPIPFVSTAYAPWVATQFDMFQNNVGNTAGNFKLSDYQNYRILRIGVRLLGWKDDSSPISIPVGEGLQVTYLPSVGTPPTQYEAEVGAWLTPDYQRAATQQIRWIGETNPFPKIQNANSYYGGSNFSRAWFRTHIDAGVSWTYADLAALDSNGGTDLMRIWGLPGAATLQTAVYLDFLELIVEVTPERRLGNAVQNVSSTPQYAASPLGPASYSPSRVADVPLRSTLNELNILTITASPNDYTLVAREALPASSSDYYPALATAPNQQQFTLGGIVPSTLVSGSTKIPYNLPQVNLGGIAMFTATEAVGPSLAYVGYTQPRPMSPNQRPLASRIVVDGVFASAALPLDQYELSFGAMDTANFLTVGAMFPVFQGMAPPGAQQVYVGQNQIQTFNDGAGAVYDQVRIVCKPDPLTTSPLSVIVSPSGAIAIIDPVVDWPGGEDLGYGWRAVTKKFNAGSYVGTGIVTTITMNSATSQGAPWSVAAVRAIAGNFFFAFEPLAPTTSPSNGIDSYPVVLECSLASPNVTLSTATTTLGPVDTFGVSVCRSGTVDQPTIFVNNFSAYDRTVIERSVNGGITWTFVGELEPPFAFLIDQECPWDVGGAIYVMYRVTGYRDSDRRSTSAVFGPWIGQAVSPGAAFGLSSNVAGFSVAYMPADPNQVNITWNPLNPVSTIPLHGVDYQYALRAPEERGLSVTVAVLVDYISYCCMQYTPGLFVAYDDPNVPYDDAVTPYDGNEPDLTNVCAVNQYFSQARYDELLSKGDRSMSPRPYERDILNVFNSSAPWVLKLPGGHTRFVTVTVGAMTITPAAGVYMAELTLTDIQIPSSDPYDD